MAVNMVGGEKGGGLNFVTYDTFRVLVSHMHRHWCPNDKQSLCHF